MLTRTFFPAAFRNGSRNWDPFAELQRINTELSRVFERGNGRSWSAEYPALNVWSNEEKTVVQAELPGFEAEDLDISVVQNTLTLRGSRKAEELREGESYHRRERWNGKFARTLELPFEVDNDKVEARFNNGLLSIELPRAAEHKPRKIAVKAS